MRGYIARDLSNSESFFLGIRIKYSKHLPFCLFSTCSTPNRNTTKPTRSDSFSAPNPGAKQRKDSIQRALQRLFLDSRTSWHSKCNRRYPPVNKHSNGKSPSWIGNTSSNGGFSIAMLDYRRVHPRRLTAGTWKWWFGKMIFLFQGKKSQVPAVNLPGCIFSHRFILCLTGIYPYARTYQR